MSMEALGLLSGCSSNSTLQTSLILPMSFSSFLQRNYGNPLKIKALVALPRTAWKGSRNRLQYCNAIGKLNDCTALEITTDWEKPQLRRKRLAVFVSGGGSNFMSIHEACLQGSVHGDIVVLVTNKAGCGGAEYAKKMGIPVILFPRTKHEPDGQSTSDLVSTFGRFGVDFILLAGYLKLIPAELIRAYPQSIVNIHPSLLPAFGGKGYYGMKVHKAVITSGARYSGPTIHFVDEHYDEGRILAQRVVPVQANDTAEELASRVLEVEHQLYVEVAAALCEERIHWRDDGVPIIQSRENPDKYS